MQYPIAGYYWYVLGVNNLRFDGGFLIGRVLAFAVLAGATDQIDAPLLVAVALLAGTVTTVALATNRRWLLPYGFLAATALWGGAIAMIVINGTDGLNLLFALILLFLDASTFVTLRCGDQS